MVEKLSHTYLSNTSNAFDVIRDYRTALLRNGYLPVPIYSADQAWLRKAAGKRPVGDGWQVTAMERAGQTE